jgi:hypothetical protein
MPWPAAGQKNKTDRIAHLTMRDEFEPRLQR